jgi:uncharacterized protein YcbK (DUF882 family)
MKGANDVWQIAFEISIFARLKIQHETPIYPERISKNETFRPPEPQEHLLAKLNKNGIAAIITTVLLGSTGTLLAASSPTTLHLHHRTHAAAKAKAAAPVESAGTQTVSPVDAPAASLSDEFRLKLNNLHTGESLDIVYRVGDTYVPDALAKLNYFLRDHNTQDVTQYDPKEFDVLHSVLAKLRRPDGIIDIVCGYRTPETNAALRHNSRATGVAEHSQHMEGHAIDIRVSGVTTVQLRDAALSLHAGGVGYYPISQFVHVDVGPVRTWAFGAAPTRPGTHRATHRISTGM